MRLVDLDKLCTMHNLIHLQCTGNTKEFAKKVGLGRAQLGKYLNYCRYELHVAIAYDKYRQTYYYEGGSLCDSILDHLRH